MRERSITSCIYVFVVLMLAGVACLSGVLVHQINHRNHKREILYKDKVIKRTTRCSLEVEKIVYRDRIVYKDKIISTDLILPVTKNKRMTYGISLVGASLDSKIGRGYYYGFGFKMQYMKYYVIAEVADNKSLILSLGYEF